MDGRLRVISKPPYLYTEALESMSLMGCSSGPSEANPLHLVKNQQTEKDLGDLVPISINFIGVDGPLP